MPRVFKKSTVRPADRNRNAPPGLRWCGDCDDYRPETDFYTKGEKIDCYCKAHARERRMNRYVRKAVATRKEESLRKRRAGTQVIEISGFDLVEVDGPSSSTPISSQKRMERTSKTLIREGL